MDYKPFTGVPCAYHLHYHFCFQTKFNRPIFSSPESAARLTAALEPVCNHSKYHLLGHTVERDRLYCLVSLKADHVISQVARTLKSNLARRFNLDLPEKDRNHPLWSIGYYVGSVGKASKTSAQRYIDNQGEHHGIRNKASREIMRWVNPELADLTAEHATFDLSYHVVLVASKRIDVFDQYIAPHLFKDMTDLAPAKGFYIERMSLLYDHIHLLVRITPSSSIRSCVEDLMNHSWRFMMDRYAGVLKSTGNYNVWTESFYVSTVGKATTAQIKSFLNRNS